MLISTVFPNYVGRVYTNTSTELQNWKRKCLVDKRGQRRMARLVQANRKDAVTQKTTLYDHGEQKSKNLQEAEVGTGSPKRRLGFF